MKPPAPLSLIRVVQRLESAPLPDPAAEVRRRLDALDLAVPRGDIAITAGSRGIANIAAITRAVGDWLKARGARPFLVPCMGSHNGATAAGQRAMLESLGLTEDAMQMEIRAGMDVVEVGRAATGPVYMDRHCHAAAGVVVLNRIKLHTAFSGPYQSGLVKMLVVGMGKIGSARTFHEARPAAMPRLLPEMARCLLDTGRILTGVAVLEDGYDRTAEIHALPGSRILEEEPRLLERSRRYFPRLPLDDLNVLVVDRIGKTVSGTGMDTHVIGTRGIRGGEDLESPRIRVLAALRLHPASQGNAIGVGLADVITRELRDAIDERKTYLNVITTGELQRLKIPATFASDEALVNAVRERFGDHGWMFIPDTLHLDRLYAGADLAQALAAHPRCTLEGAPFPLTFRHGRHTLDFPCTST